MVVFRPLVVSEWFTPIADGRPSQNGIDAREANRTRYKALDMCEGTAEVPPLDAVASAIKRPIARRDYAGRRAATKNDGSMRRYFLRHTA